jgi:itaconate CoA-transferase
LQLRARTGEGSFISVSMFDAMADWMTVPLLQHEYGMPPRRMGLAHPSIAPYGVFATKSGASILISIQNDREWRTLASQVFGDAPLSADGRFATNVERVARRSETDALVAAFFSSCETAELIDRLAKADIAFAVLNDMAGLGNHPQLRRVDVATPSGPVSYPLPPARLGGKAASYGAVPALGQNTASVRSEFLSKRDK